MRRRQFIGGLLASAAVRTWPFRVFSFPSEIVFGVELEKWAHEIPNVVFAPDLPFIALRDKFPRPWAFEKEFRVPLHASPSA